MRDHDDYEPDHESSPTDHVLNELQLHGYRPFADEPDQRLLPDGNQVAGAVADIFDALIGTLEDTRVIGQYDNNVQFGQKASVMLVRGCEYQGQNVQTWTVDMVPPGAAIDEDLKRDLLGARRKILFVEGTEQSLDAPLYSLLFPQISVIPKESCREVEHSVRGLRSAPDMHWMAAWGLVDNDQRSQDDITRLRSAGIWALSHYSVESLYYHPKIVARVAERQAQVTGSDASTLTKSAIDSAIAATKAQKDHLVTSAVLRSARDKVLNTLPRRDDVVGGGTVKVEVDISLLRQEEENRFDALIAATDWDGLLSRYPLRESSAFDRIVSGIKIADKDTYRAAVLKLLQDDATAVDDLRGLLGDLYASVVA